MNFKTRVELKYRIVAQVKKISLAEAHKRGLFGPVYHGTSPENREKIEREGFKVFIGKERDADVRHGYQAAYYADGKPAPVHHIGFGVYMTTIKAIAKRFNNDSLKGLKTYYLDIPRKETINFGSNNTMMKWWVSNGYDIPQVYPAGDIPLAKISDLRLEATKHLTDTLKEKYDAVWYKGKGLHKLLDGDQVCVFDPSRIYEIDALLSQGMEAGSKVRRKEDGMVGVIQDVKDAEPYRTQWHTREGDTPHPWLKKETKHILYVKWKKGGVDYNVQDADVEML